MANLSGYLGIDIGTQGLSITFTDQDLNEIATGDAKYDFVEGLDSGCYEQRCEDWEQGVQKAMVSLHEQISPRSVTILGIGKFL
jgi:sugar (pentulose or hexulose) kinase